MPYPKALIHFQTNHIMRKYERINILIDGKQVGDIGNYDELQVHITPGIHEITSQDKSRTKAYPLHIIVQAEDEIEITIQPVNGQMKFQFVVETIIPATRRHYKLSANANELAWDLNTEISLKMRGESKLTFDLENSAFSHPIHFELDLQDKHLAVFSRQEHDALIYESTFNRIYSLVYPFSMLDEIIEHTFYRADGRLLGYLSLENGRWIVASSNQERIAEICGAVYNGQRLYSQDHYLLSIQNGVETLAHFKNVQDNAIRFEQFSTPDKDYLEILFLAFVSFSALSWAIPVEYTPEKVLDVI